MDTSRSALILVVISLFLFGHVPRKAQGESWSLLHPVGRFSEETLMVKPELNPSDMQFLLEDAFASTVLNENDTDDPCNPNNCQATFEHSFSVPVTLPCSSASGEIPATAHLPIVYPGDYDQCNRVFGFAGAHYCTIDTTEFMGLPLRRGKFNYTGEGLVIGRLHLGKCVRKECTAEALRVWFLKRVKDTATKLKRRMPLEFAIPFLEDLIVNTTQVRCVDEDEEARGSVLDYKGSSAMAVITALLCALVVSATVYDLVFTSGGKTGSLAADLFVSVSARRSMVSLVKPMGGDFLVLNGIRVLSMAWVIFGHVVLFSFGYVTPFPVLNPSETDRQLQSFYIMLSRAAEYSVDTFFFMSGFLACIGTVQEELARGNRLGSFSWNIYMRNFVLRYTRLTPVYIFSLFFYMKLVPFLGTGPFFDAALGIEVKERECKDWWTNLLYVNDLVPYGNDGGLNGCVGWSWYLANDMQFFLLVLPLVCLYLRFQKGRRWVGYVPPLVLILIQIISTWWTMNTYDIRGSFDLDYNAYLYVKPWCRVSPYAVGIIFAFWYHDRLSEKLPWKVSSHLFWGAPPALVASAAVALLIIIGFAPYDQLRCEADDPKTDCNIFGGFIVYGAYVAKNWSHNELTAYFVLSYLGWGLAVGFLSMYFFSGRGGMVNTLLSHPSLTSLARLSYSVYLVHIPIIQYLFSTSTRPLYVSKQTQMTNTVAVIFISYLVSLILYLVVERPAMSLMSILLRYWVVVPHVHQTTTSQEAQPLRSNQVNEPPRVSVSQEQEVRQPLLGRATH